MNNLNLEELVRNFFTKVENENMEIYSESNMEIRLSQYLLDNVPNGFKVETQRNVDFFGIDKNDVLKRKMDIVIYNEDKSIKYEIELKYPATKNNKGYTNALTEIIKDINFTEQLREKGFTDTYFLVITDHQKIYSNIGVRNNELTTDGLYSYFRAGKEITGQIENYNIKGNYKINWVNCGDKKYYLGRTNNQ